MTELTWLILGLWIFFLAAYWVTKKTVAGGFGSLIGLFFSLMLLTDSAPIGFILIGFNIYLLYVAIIKPEKKS